MTLSESLVAIFIFALITLLLISIFIAYNGLFKTQLAYNELNSNNTIALNSITKNIRGAIKVADSATINSIEYTTDNNTLVLELASIDNDGLIISDTYDYLAYELSPADNSILQSNIESNGASSRTSGTKMASQYVDTINFNYNNTDYGEADKIEIILITSQEISGKKQQLIMQSTTELRNK